MPIKVLINRDTEGNPTGLKVVDRGRIANVTVTENELQLEGRLSEPMRDLLKLFLPYNPATREFYEGAPIATANADTFAGAAAVNTVLYTVPQGKKLYILTAYCCISNNGGVVPYGDIHVYDPPHDTNIDLVGFGYTLVNIEVQSAVVGEIQYGFPAGHQVTVLTGANSYSVAGFIGVIKDA